MSSKTEYTVNFTAVHKSVPMVSITLEPSIGGSSTTARIKAVSETSTTVEFSSEFDGYLHLHAFSEI